MALAWLWAIVLVFVVRCYHWCKAAALSVRRSLATGLPGRPSNKYNLQRRKATILTASIFQLIGFKEFLKLDPDSSSPAVNLHFQGTGGGVLVVHKNKLNIVRSTDTPNWNILPQFQETALSFSSQNYFLFGYPESRTVGITTTTKRSFDGSIIWKRRKYAEVLPEKSQKKYEKSSLLQLWDDKYQYPPEDPRSLYFIIKVDDSNDDISFELGSPSDAKTNGAGAVVFDSNN